jgi:hypothetical protein
VAEQIVLLGALLLAVFGSAALGGALVGMLMVRALRDSAVEPADAFDGYDPDGPGEETVRLQAEVFDPPPADPLAGVAPELREVAAAVLDLDAPTRDPAPDLTSTDVSTGLWPVTRRQRLDPVGGETVRIRVRTKGGPDVEPYRWQGQHRGPESRADRPEPLYLAGTPFQTSELPVLDWSARTEELRQVDGVSG